MYLDSDMLVLNDPSVLPDGIAKQAKHEFNGAVFRFRSPYHPLFSELFDDYVRSYNGQIWGWQGEGILYRWRAHSKAHLCRPTALYTSFETL